MHLWNISNLLFIGLVLKASFTDAQSPQLKIMPDKPSQTKPMGSSMILTCMVQGVSASENAELQWINDDGVTITDKTGRVYIESPNLTTLKLYLTNIIEEDAGTYRCRGRVGGQQVEKSMTLMLYKDITFEEAESPQNPVIDTDALIKCRVSGQPVPTVSWRYEGALIQSGGRYDYEPDGLRIRAITEEDNGRYECRAEVTVDGNLKTKTIEVEVHIPPKITDSAMNAQGIEGQEAEISCRGEGKPPPKYEFYKGNSQAPLHSNDDMEVDNNGGTVRFVKLKREFGGQYKCRAINPAGSDEVTGELQVIVPPRIHEFDNTTARESQTGILICSTDGDPPPTMTFQKVGSDQPYQEGDNEGTRIKVTKIESRKLQLAISNLTPKDTANYTCTGTNAAGTYQRNGSIVVHFEPRFDPEHENQVFTWAGKRRNVTCTAMGEPEPVLHWKRGDEIIDRDNETYKIYNLGRTKVLQVKIEEGQEWFYGKYLCNAKNKYGDADLEMNVRMATLPDKPSAAAVKDHSPTTVVLSVSPPEDNGGVPVYGYRVAYDSHIQDFRIGDEIRLENLRPATNYIFRVRAKNEVGPGNYFELTWTTENIRSPYPIVVESEREGKYPYTYVVRWEKPRTGGLPIKEYRFKYARVQIQSDDNWIVEKPLEPWVTIEVEDNENAPMLFYTLQNLKHSSYYKLDVQARNDIDWSLATEHVFKTSKGYNTGGGDTGEVIGGSTSVHSNVLLFIFIAILSQLL